MKLSTFNFQLSTNRGFTLIELLVAMAVFSVVVAIAAGGFVRALRTQAQILALIAVNSNSSLTLEQMAREIRTGYDFACGKFSSDGVCSELNFKNADGFDVRYGLIELPDGGTIGRGTGGDELRPITADNVRADYLLFFIAGADLNGEFPPRISLFLGIRPRQTGLISSAVNLQTTVSARYAE